MLFSVWFHGKWKICVRAVSICVCVCLSIWWWLDTLMRYFNLHLHFKNFFCLHTNSFSPCFLSFPYSIFLVSRVFSCHSIDCVSVFRILFILCVMQTNKILHWRWKVERHSEVYTLARETTGSAFSRLHFVCTHSRNEEYALVLPHRSVVFYFWVVSSDSGWRIKWKMFKMSSGSTLKLCNE